MGGASRASGLPRAAANAVSGRKPGPTLWTEVKYREKKSCPASCQYCDAVDKEKLPRAKRSENKYNPCLPL